MSEAIQTPGESERLETLERRVDDLNNYFATAMQRIRDLEAENERLRDRVAELEATQPDTDGYPDDRDTRIGMVRSHLIERARNQHGKAAIDYKDVKYGVFQGEPSPGHCYDLMERAADMDGFAYDRPSGEGGQKRVRVNLDGVNDLDRFHAVNNGSLEEGR